MYSEWFGVKDNTPLQEAGCSQGVWDCERSTIEEGWQTSAPR
jgi:hypothetical protein